MATRVEWISPAQKCSELPLKKMLRAALFSRHLAQFPIASSSESTTPLSVGLQARNQPDRGSETRQQRQTNILFFIQKK
jgi:hypothetical protein